MTMKLSDLRRVVDCGSDLCSCADTPLPVTVADLVDALIAEGGETIWWCESHRYQSSHEQGRCVYSVMKLMQIRPEEVGGCRIVEKLTFPIPAEEETTT